MRTDRRAADLQGANSGRSGRDRPAWTGAIGYEVLVRLGLRRDRWLLPAWVLGLAAMAGFSASATVGLYPTETSRIEAARALDASAAIVALYGRVYDPTSAGALSMIKLTAFGSAVIGIAAVFAVVRHTRAEEESGRLELLSGARVGRSAPVVAALVIAAGASIAVGLGTTVANAAAGLPWRGSLAFGAGWTATGLVYATVGAVAAQVTMTARGARVVGLAVVAVTYGLRAVGDLAEPGPSPLSWLSPIGWNQQIRAYAGDRWLVLVLPMLAAVALAAAAVALRGARDLGAGLRVERAGPSEGAMSDTFGLAWRLQRPLLGGWAVGFAVGGLLLGSLSSSVQDLVTSEQMREMLERLGGEGALVDAFLASEIAVLGSLAAAYGVGAAARLRSEEVDGHTELLLATQTSRLRWAAGHHLLALAGVAALLLVAGCTMGTAAALSLRDGSQVGRVVVAAAAQIPAAWVLTSLVALCFGWVPRATGAVWGVLVACIALGEFGAIWNLPGWLTGLSPFRHSPQLPSAEGVVVRVLVPVLVLTALAVVASVGGALGWARRDLAP